MYCSRIYTVYVVVEMICFKFSLLIIVLLSSISSSNQYDSSENRFKKFYRSTDDLIQFKKSVEDVRGETRKCGYEVNYMTFKLSYVSYILFNALEDTWNVCILNYGNVSFEIFHNSIITTFSWFYTYTYFVKKSFTHWKINLVHYPNNPRNNHSSRGQKFPYFKAYGIFKPSKLHSNSNINLSFKMQIFLILHF